MCLPYYLVQNMKENKKASLKTMEESHASTDLQFVVGRVKEFNDDQIFGQVTQLSIIELSRIEILKIVLNLNAKSALIVLGMLTWLG